MKVELRYTDASGLEVNFKVDIEKKSETDTNTGVVQKWRMILPAGITGDKMIFDYLINKLKSPIKTAFNKRDLSVKKIKANFEERNVEILVAKEYSEKRLDKRKLMDVKQNIFKGR